MCGVVTTHLRSGLGRDNLVVSKHLVINHWETKLLFNRFILLNCKAEIHIRNIGILFKEPMVRTNS